MRHMTELPKPSPKGLAQKLILAWLAYHSDRVNKNGGKAEHEASIRYIAVQFRFAKASGAERAITTLRETQARPEGPWIQVATQSVGAHGNRYCLGPASLSNTEKWIALGKTLFGPAGILTPYMARPILQRPGYGLGLNGCLVLGVVEKFGPLSHIELHQLLKGFFDQRTLKTALARSTSLDFILRDEGELLTPRNLRDRIRHVESVSGADARARAFDRAVGQEQHEFQVELNGGATLTNTMQRLWKENCFYCETVPAPEGGAVEHFPPKHWGGSDQHSLLLPICTRCNSRHGALLRRTPSMPSPTDIPSRILFPGDLDECRELLSLLMMTNAASYANALDNGDVEAAITFARSAFAPWIALKEGHPIVNALDGEIQVAASRSEDAVVFAQLTPLGGLPRSLPGMSREAS